MISSNIPLRQDGLPYANRPEPDDKGVAVYFTLNQQPMCFACDRWDKVRDNLQAIRHTISALRGIERWGTGEMVRQAFRGFTALPAADDPYSILGVASGATVTQIELAYRQRAKQVHPDCGGSVEAMQKLNEAKRTLLARAS